MAEPIARASDHFPARPRAHRTIEGESPSGVKISGHAYADPLPDRLGYGPFYGEGQFALSRGGSYVVGNIRFEEIPEIIAILQDVLAAATAPADPQGGAS